MIPQQRKLLIMKMYYVIMASCHRDLITMVIMLVSLDKTVMCIVPVRKVTVRVGYVMAVTNRVPIMHTINGLIKKMSSDDQVNMLILNVFCV